MVGVKGKSGRKSTKEESVKGSSGEARKLFSSMFTRSDKNPNKEYSQAERLAEYNKRKKGDMLERLKEITEARKIISDLKSDPDIDQSLINEFETQFGIKKKDDKKEEEDTGAIDRQTWVMLQALDTIEDPEIKKIVAMSMFLGKKSGGNDIMPMLMMQNMSKKEKPKDEYENMALKLLSTTLEKQMSKDPLDNIEKVANVLEKLGGGNKDNDFEKFQNHMTLAKEWGILSDPQNDIEGRKIDLDEKRIDNDFELKKSEMEQNNLIAQNQMGLAKTGMNTLINTVGHMMKKGGKSGKKSSNDTEQTTKPRPKMEVVRCDNPKCQKEFSIVLDKEKIVNCPNGCGFDYVVAHDDNEKLNLFHSQETDEKLAQMQQE